MDIYLEKLMKQFTKANGLNKIDMNSLEFLNEFKEWVTRQRVVSRDYKDLLNYMQIPLSKIAEVGKGEFDSLALNNNLLMITPYAEELALENDKIINADFMVTVEKPLVIGPDKKEIILDRRINSFMTYNPYEEEDIINWELLVGQGYPITTGVYGKIYDQDKTTKIKLLKNLKNKILQEVQEEYVTLEDKYLYVISSTPKIKKLNKMI